jgi:hypothetical protein
VTNKFVNRVAGGAIILTFGLAANAETKHLQFPPPGAPTAQTPAGQLKSPKLLTYHGAGLKNLTPAQLEQAATTSGLPLYHYVVPAAVQDGLHYDGYVVGGNPNSPMPVSVPTSVIPLRIHFLDPFGNEVFRFSPDAADPCQSGMSASMLTGNSPLFNSTMYMMNGQNVGNTQYVDAFRRADLWSKVKNTNYHLYLSPTLMPTIDIDVLYGAWAYGIGTCSVFGAVDISLWDAFTVQVLLPFVGATPDKLPLFLTHNFAFTVGGGCCVLGYHSVNQLFALKAQTYSTSDFESSGFFPADYNDTLILSHELAEWADDPFVVNPTPSWGNTGQVVGCQGNLEVGDPLTPTAFPPVMMNGFTYHLQELAFTTWFFGGPGMSAGGLFSNNGTFTAPSTLCQ